MTTVNNPVLGYIDCDGCSEKRITVHQTQRGKGRYLYTRCPECKCDQRTSKKVQQRLWDKTEWLDGHPENPPLNVVLEPIGTATEQPQPIGSQDGPEDFDPRQQKSQQKSEKIDQEPAQNAGSRGWGVPLLIAGIGGAIAVAAAVASGQSN